MILTTAPTREHVQSALHTILVVDHRETIRRVLALILEGEGYQVITTDTASAAVAVAFETRPAAIMLDLSLAEHSAIWALRSLKSQARTQDIPVIVLAACAGALNESDRALTAAVLTKPLDLDALVLSVGSMLKQAA